MVKVEEKNKKKNEKPPYYWIKSVSLTDCLPDTLKITCMKVHKINQYTSTPANLPEKKNSNINNHKDECRRYQCYRIFILVIFIFYYFFKRKTTLIQELGRKWINYYAH